MKKIGMSALFVESPNQELRKALSRITEKPIRDQVSLIEALRSTHRHSISVEEPGHPPYNCVQYAFNLIDLPDRIRNTIERLESWRVQRQLWRIDPFDTTFVNFLIERGVLQELNCAESEDVIVYRDKERVRHAGKIQVEFVHSKWGGLGHLWQHRVYEVPKGYGDAVRLFKSVDRNETLRYLSAFMEEIRSAQTPRRRKELLTSLHHPWP